MKLTRSISMLRRATLKVEVKASNHCDSDGDRSFSLPVALLLCWADIDNMMVAGSLESLSSMLMLNGNLS